MTSGWGYNITAQASGPVLLLCIGHDNHNVVTLVTVAMEGKFQVML